MATGDKVMRQGDTLGRLSTRRSLRACSVSPDDLRACSVSPDDKYYSSSGPKMPFDVARTTKILRDVT